MIVDRLAERVIETVQACTPLQRQALRRALVVGLEGPEQIALWEAVRPALYADSADDTASLADLRAAAEEMPFEAWAAFNDLIFHLHRGNIFDDGITRLEGGGIEFAFAQAARWHQFLALVEEEREYLGIASPLVLDAGCWQGTLICELLQRGYAVGGCDISAGMEEVVRERVSWLKPDDAARFLGFRAGPIHESLAGPDTQNRFDIVCCQETLEHVPARVLQQTCDALVGAARHTVLTTTPWDDGWSLHLHAFTEADLRRLFHDEDPQRQVECLVPAAFGNYTTMRVRRHQQEAQ